MRDAEIRAYVYLFIALLFEGVIRILFVTLFLINLGLWIYAKVKQFRTSKNVEITKSKK